MGKIKLRQHPLLVTVLATLVWMVLIFWFSAQDATQSSAMSGKLLKWLLKLVVPHWKTRSAAEQAHIIDMVHTVFRKLGHFTEYTVLGVFLTLTCRRANEIIWNKSWQTLGKLGNILPVLLALCYAATDELHQKFVAGRSCELRDVLIDTLGACTGVALTHLLTRLCRNYKHWRRKRYGS